MKAWPLLNLPNECWVDIKADCSSVNGKVLLISLQTCVHKDFFVKFNLRNKSVLMEKKCQGIL